MAHEDKLKVFISYSRDDLKFADQLDAALDSTGFECTIDRHGIHGGEDWKLRLGNLILESDTVVFVLSPSSAKSSICEWEVEEALRRGKRILPVLCRELEGAAPPKQLQDLNYIYFYDEPKAPGSGFGAGLSALLASLNTDLDWLREHTRLLERANEWAEGGRQEATLLFGSSIAEAKQWAEQRSKSAPEITALHLEYIRASEEADARRKDVEVQRLQAIAAAQEERAKAIADREAAQKREIEASRTIVLRTMVGMIAASVLALAATGAGIYAYRKQDEALSAKNAAESHLKRAAEASSLFRAMQAREALGKNDPLVASVVAMNGVPDLTSPEEFERKRPFYPEAFLELHRAWSKLMERAVLSGHGGGVTAIAASPDGKFLVTVSDDNTARLWDGTGQPKKILSGHNSPLTSVAIAPDSSAIVIGSQDHTASIWASDGTFKVRLSGHKGGITSVAFSPDGTKILTASRDREARLWSLDGKTLAVFSGHNGVVTSGEVSPDGRLVLTGSEDQTAALWDLGGSRVATLVGHTGSVLRATFAPASDLVATASEDATARLWTDKGELKAVLTQHAEALTDVVFSPDGALVATGSRDKSAALWDREGRLVTVLAGHEGAVLSLAFAPDGQRLVTASEDAAARVWSRDGKLVAELKGHEGPISGAVFSAQGGSVLTASGDRTARLWDIDPAKAIALESDAGPAVGVVFAAAAPYVVTGHEGGLAVVWDRAGHKLAELKSKPDAALKAVEVSADGQHILTRYASESVLWDRAGAEILTISGEQGKTARLSPDGQKLLVLAGAEGKLEDLKGNVIATYALGSRADTAQFSTDGKRIVVALGSGAIDVWNADGKKIDTFFGDVGQGELTVVSPDAQFALRSFAPRGENPNGSSVILELVKGSKPLLLGYQVTSAARVGTGWLVVFKDGSAHLVGRSGRIIGDVDPSYRFGEAIGGAGEQQLRMLAALRDGGAVLLDGAGQPVLSIEEGEGAALSPDGTMIATTADGTAYLWPAYRDPQTLVDEIKTKVPRCLSPEVARELRLDTLPQWCRDKYPATATAAMPVETSRAPPDQFMPGPEVDFAYYPPGDISHSSEHSGRLGDRKVYLKDIAFPLKLARGQHAFMNSQIYGYGGGGYNGKGAPGGRECDPRNYDSMRQRDTYCEIRGWEMPLCPTGTGKQGQSIRPPTCEVDRWDVVAVVDGVISNVTSNTTVMLKGTDGTTYYYLHMSPQSISVKEGQRVNKGDVIGRVGNYMNGMPATTISLTLNVKQRMSIGGKDQDLFIPIYSSLIAAYRELKGLDRGIDAEGNLIVDPDHEIGAGKIPRPPE
jgi:WD40 repeat protein